MLLYRAMEFCKVRGFISRDSDPRKHYWKNTSYFDKLQQNLAIEDQFADDWSTHDPDGEGEEKDEHEKEKN